MKRALVRRAALMLDKRYPGWHRKVKLSTLVLGSASRCITAQLGLDTLEREELPQTILYATLWDEPKGVEIETADVQVPWEEEIRARRRRVPA